MRHAVRVYEIEHSADRDAALRGIVRAGAKVIEAVPDAEEESVAVLVEFPGSRTELLAALRREDVCL